MSSPTGDQSNLVAELSREVRWLSARSVLFSHLAAERVGLRPTDLEALDILALTGPIPAGRLAALTGLSSGSVTALIDRLEAAGCARREPDPADRRRVIVHPLPWPEPMAAAAQPLYEAMGTGFAELCRQYPDEELALILRFLRGANAMGAAAITQVQEMTGSERPQRAALDREDGA
jgi:DNA-binding MarR family transcriptional regulator